MSKQWELGHISGKPPGAAETFGWMAPELLKSGSIHAESKADIFSLGCVFYYTVTGGEHPFGEEMNRLSNIENGQLTLNALTDETAKILIRKMLSHDPTHRHTAAAVGKHPFFWSKDYQLKFFCAAYEHLNKTGEANSDKSVLEEDKYVVIGLDWTLNIDPLLQESEEFAVMTMCSFMTNSTVAPSAGFPVAHDLFHFLRFALLEEGVNWHTLVAQHFASYQSILTEEVKNGKGTFIE
uniref:Protein kinase domain-containing protein n=1 Tax=Plectus sambesii TaxID=2011161 RepID=A0A914W193_9BILA